MNYIDKIFQRATLYQVVSFLLYGSGSTETVRSTYEERLDQALEQSSAVITELLPNFKSQDRVITAMIEYGCTVQDVYMEVGLQIGASLQKQFFQHFGS